MAIAILGVNHASAPVQIRERVAFDPALLDDFLQNLCELDSVNEAVILSTCNRTEIYASSNDLHMLQNVLTDWLMDSHALDDLGRDQISKCLYYKQEQDCIRHALQVACGLDSMVLGEPQIFGQVKSAYQHANVYGSLKQELDNVFQFVFRTAKRIRTETRIGNHAVSLASASVQLGRKIFSGFDKHTAMLIGAGETIELVAQHLQQQGLKRMVFANRTIENANRLAHQFQGYAISLEDVELHLAEADMLFTSTASPEPILSETAFIQALKSRKHKPMFVIDLAVPRDIEPGVKDMDEVYLYSIDDLQEIISDNQQARQSEAVKAREIVETALIDFSQAKNLRKASPAIRELREHYEKDRDELLGTALDKLNAENAEQILTQFAHQLTNRFLHRPTKILRKGISEDQPEKVNTLVQLLLPETETDSSEE
ncbi:MAG: glutamyl-tRNA reductase [Gammaproteobacteria bacterium]|nr:glutamyl-tRNA reductase [Gammaproteobacteria bacterium]NNC96924.1 glutamyl-tRNA reductase [Gammaproteobacteria bacterium]NNM13339.1 glutamyl-tRNA reductase [Gammaproteobacteria bacterium]